MNGSRNDSHFDERACRPLEPALDVAISILDPNGTIQSWNEAAQRIKGYAAHEVLGRSSALFYSPEAIERGELADLLSAAQQRGECRTQGWRVRKDGSRFWADVHVSRLTDDGGNFVGYAKLVRDFSRQSFLAEQHRLLAAGAPHAMLIFDAQREVTLANARAEQLFGFGPGELERRRIDQLLSTGADLASFLDACQADGDDRATPRWRGPFDLLARRRDGSTFNVEATATVARTMRGPVVVSSFVDITDRVRLEKQLADANRLMATAEELSRTGYWRVDLQTGARTWSPVMLDAFGFDDVPTREEAMACRDPAGPDIVAITDRAERDGEPFEWESRIHRRDGTSRDIVFRGVGERDPDGSVIGLVGVLIDVTDRRRSEAELRTANRLMTMAEEMAHYGHWQLEIATMRLTCSAEVRRLYRLAPNERPTLDRFVSAYGERSDVLRAILEQGVADGLPFDFEGRLYRPDRTFRNVVIAGRGERDAQGRLGAVFGIVLDVTELKDAERERRWSTTFQRAVLPSRLPQVAGCTFDAIYEAGTSVAQVGGDWYDALRLSDGRILMSIGDVTGSGIEAAVVGGVVRQIMRGIAQLHADPILVLDAADRALRLEYPGVYVSAWVGLVDLVEETLTYGSAGQPPPISVSADGSLRELHEPTALLVGLREGHHGQSRVATLADGDNIVLFTDGITEVTHDILAGYGRVRKVVATLAGTQHADAAKLVKQAVIPDGSLDDVAIMVAHIDLRAARARMRRWTIDARNGANAAALRDQLRTELVAHDLTAEDCTTAELIFGELIGNVVRHAGAAADVVDVVLEGGGPSPILHVMDRGPGYHHYSQLPSDLYAEGGRGLFLVGALALELTVSPRANGGSHTRVTLPCTKRPTAVHLPVRSA